MLRYKKHKRHADGLAGSGVGVMDDTDREVSSFTDRAFRSLCVAEEEPFNDVPHIPSPIRGMPLSTKYHLGIFNLSVRKTQPLAQLPTISRQRAKWAPTFQPLLNCAKDGLIVSKTNANKLCIPQPTGYKPCSKVSSLIRSFDNIENEKPEQEEFSLSKTVQRGKINMEEISICHKVEHNDMHNEALECINPDDMGLQESRNLHRRTAREVFLESQAEICSRLSASPCSSGSPLPDQAKKLVNQKESLRRTVFLHSENSAFKSWSDINNRHPGGDDSDNSFPGTPPILRSATPCSPLLQKPTPGVRTRDAGLEVGWASPASVLSNSFDAIQMLRTVPPLPNKRMTKQSKELSQRVPKVHVENKIQTEDMQVDIGNQSPKEQLHSLAKPKSPKKLKQASNTNKEEEAVSEKCNSLTKQIEVVQEKLDSSQSQKAREPETPVKEDDKISNIPIPPSGRIKTIIQQIEKESIKDVVPLHLPEKIHNLKELNEAPMETLPNTVPTKHLNSNLHSDNNVHVPPWRRMHVYKTESEDKLFNKHWSIKESATEITDKNMTSNEENCFEEKPGVSSFNITNLLTPVIRRKSIQEALEEQSMVITPAPADTMTLNDQDQREISLYHKRNEYKSKATSLLFNLKDMRKRVKSTYNPSTNLRNSYENNQTADSKLQEVSTCGIPLIDTSKPVSEIENVSNTNQAYVSRKTKEEEDKYDCFGNISDNYLHLSSPSQVKQCKIFENAEILTEDVRTDDNIQKEYMSSSHLSPIEQNIKNNVEDPSLNLNNKEDTTVKVEQKQDASTKPVWRQKAEEFILQEENIKPHNKQEELSDTVSMPTSYFLETDVKIAQNYTNQFLTSPEMVNQCLAEGDEGGKQKIKNDCLKDELQYYAVSNSNVEISKKQHEISKEVHEEKVEDKELLVSGIQGEDSTNTEEIKRPSGIIHFKPNLFQIKDNKIKSSPVTKPVRPLLRSLSEDCLIFNKGDDNSFTTGKGDLRPSSWKNRDDKLEISKTENMAAHNEKKHLNNTATKPVLESVDHNHREYQQLETQHEQRKIQELWEKPCCLTLDWGKNEEVTTEFVKANENSTKNSSPLDGPHFHPVETCISEVTGLSPECNTLLVHHTSDSLTNLVNGEHASSPLLGSANTNYSSLDSGLLQFEDAICFSEDIACSTITSPMSESITCSMVASPMSVNTQSSGFTTALSALDDMPSPPLTCVNSRNGKSNLLVHDVMNIVPTPSGNLETTTNECIKHPQEKAPCVDSSNKDHTAKPPTVPPKTEKALRRAKRLTKKRRKTEISPKIHEGDFEESDFVLDVPSPASVIPSSLNPQSNFKLGSCFSRSQLQESISETSTPSLSTTQRKLLQDPDSGQYFVVDIPVHFRIKTFFDPETGKYLQMSLPPSERSTPTLEMSSSPFMLYQGLAPVPVASIASLKGESEILNHSGLHTDEKSGSWHEDGCLKMQQSIDCDSCDQSMAGTPHSMDKNAGRTRSPDIISMRDIDDFAMEAIS